jgi:hypothetical protein
MDGLHPAGTDSPNAAIKIGNTLRFMADLLLAPGVCRIVRIPPAAGQGKWPFKDTWTLLAKRSALLHFPQQFLYFLPLPQGHWLFRPGGAWEA